MDVPTTHSIWIKRFQQYLKLYLEAFLSVNVNPDIDERIRRDIISGKIIRAYIIATKYDESFRIISKSKLFFTFRQVISAYFVQTMNNRMQEQIGEISKWMSVSLQEVESEFISYISTFNLPVIKYNDEYETSTSPLNIGIHLHNIYGIPLVRYLLPLLNVDPATHVVCSTGRIPHAKIPVIACTPDLIVVGNEDSLYDDINQSIIDWDYKSLAGHGLKIMIEIKTYHKIRVSKMDAFRIYDKIRQNQDVKDDLLQQLHLLIQKQQITTDYKVDGKQKQNECFVKNCVLYPVDKYHHTSISHKLINKFGFLRGIKPKQFYSLENICGEKTQGRLWLMFYDPHDPGKVPMKYVLYDKSPFLFTPCSDVFYQMLEQKCVLQYHNPDITSLFIGIFSLEPDDVKKPKIFPSIVFVLEVFYDTFVTSSFEESVIRLMCQTYPQMFQNTDALSMTKEDVDQFVKICVWSQEEHDKRSLNVKEHSHVIKAFD